MTPSCLKSFKVFTVLDKHVKLLRRASMQRWVYSSAVLLPQVPFQPPCSISIGMLFAPTVHKLIRISYNLSLFTPFQVFPTPTWLLHPILLSVWLTARAFIAQVAFLLASSPCSPDPFSISSSLFRLLVHGSVFALLCLHVPLPFSSTRVSRDEDMPFIHFCTLQGQ